MMHEKNNKIYKAHLLEKHTQAEFDKTYAITSSINDDNEDKDHDHEHEEGEDKDDHDLQAY